MTQAQNIGLLRIEGVSMQFGAVEALADVSLTVYSGETVALLGDNGAGKSTLFKLIAGIYKPTSGTMFFNGSMLKLRNPAQGRQIGIELIHQDLAVCDNLTGGANIYLGRELVRWIGPLQFLRHAAIHRGAERFVAQLGVNVDVYDLMRNMSGGQRQAVAIARALLGDAKLILMDEPTAAISVKAVEQVLALIGRLKSLGRTVILVSHRMSDVFAVCDRVVVLSHGRVVADKVISETSEKEVAALIGGEGGSHTLTRDRRRRG